MANEVIELARENVISKSHDGKRVQVVIIAKQDGKKTSITRHLHRVGNGPGWEDADGQLYDLNI